MVWSQYLTDGIVFSDTTALDATTGAGEATLILARKIADAGGKGKVVSVDIDPDTFPDVGAKPGGLWLLTGKVFPTTGMSTLKQANPFAPRPLGAFENAILSRRQWPNAAKLIRAITTEIVLGAILGKPILCKPQTDQSFEDCRLEEK
jgi:hypothetical protein